MEKYGYAVLGDLEFGVAVEEVLFRSAVVLVYLL